MTVAFDALTESIRTDTSTTYAFDHTAAAGVRAVVVTVCHGVTTTDHISALTYGGISMTRIIGATDTASELGRADIWFLGSSVGSGTKSVSATLSSATTDDIQFVAASFTAAYDCEVIDSDSINEDVANPQRTLNFGGRSAVSVCALYSGANAGPTGTLLSGMTRMQDHDFGNWISGTARQTTAQTADFTIGYTWALEDAAFVAIAFAELTPGTAMPRRRSDRAIVPFLRPPVGWSMSRGGVLVPA